MKVELCAFSGYKIYPGHGKRAVKTDGKTYIFLNSKCERSHKMRKNPREVTWTVLYRRKHKKGLEEELQKKRSRRNTKFQRAVVGATLQDIMAKRNQKPEVRKAQREQAIRAAKEKTRAAKQAKQAKKVVPPPVAPKGKGKKNLQKAKGGAKPAQPKARVGGKR